METIVAVLVAVIFYLIVQIIILKSSLGGLVCYMRSKKYPIPTKEEMTEWGKRYIKRYFDDDTGN